MDKAALEEAVRLAADTERMAAADYRREIAEHDLMAAQDAYEYDVGPNE